jgi:hypothetical protein
MLEFANLVNTIPLPPEPPTEVLIKMQFLIVRLTCEVVGCNAFIPNELEVPAVP